MSTTYTRYHIAARPAPNVAPHPHRFDVRVSRPRLARLILGELMHYRGNMPVVLSRPCVYGVFSGPVGGFAPRPQLCVGCLRCTVQYPDMVRVQPNRARARLGDAYLTPDMVDTILYESSTGRVPVRGAGYRGAFGGPGWDGMWTDMSEIVRPTRDGIHGREFISTSVDVGEKPQQLTFDAAGRPVGERPRTLSLPLPLLFDAPPARTESPALFEALVAAAEGIESLAIVPLERALDLGRGSAAVAPLVSPRALDGLDRLPVTPRLVALDGFEEAAWHALRGRDFLVAVRLAFGDAPPERVVDLVRRGVRTFHLTADYHGDAGGRFVRDAVRAVHDRLVEDGLREQVTLLGSGGIAAADHVPKAIICGFDAVALDTAALVALQARFDGECVSRATARVMLPSLPAGWGAQRLMNLAASWRDQLLEILGAMGLREVRRLRGEVGRAMFQADVEREAFGDIEGFPALVSDGHVA